MAYGFRVFRLGAVEGPRGRRRLDVADPLGNGMSLAAYIEHAVDELTRRDLLTGVPNVTNPEAWDPSVPPENGSVQSILTGIADVGPGQQLIKLWHGYHGEFEEAFGPGGRIPLRDKAAAVQYRALVLTPAAGTEARLVVETKGRRCPVTPLTSWIGWHGYEQATQARGTSPGWVRLRTEQMADPKALAELLGKIEEVEAKLVQKSPGQPGAGWGQRISLSIRVKEQRKRQGFIELLLSGGGGGQAYVERIEEIAGFNPEELDRLGLDFDDASVSVTGNGTTKRLKVGELQARFTYPASGNFQLDDEAWLGRVMAVLDGPLSQDTDIQLF